MLQSDASHTSLCTFSAIRYNGLSHTGVAGRARRSVQTGASMEDLTRLFVVCGKAAEVLLDYATVREGAGATKASVTCRACPAGRYAHDGV